MTKAEQETIVRWDQEQRIAYLWTAYEPDARRWQRAGYDIRVADSSKDGAPRSWRGEVPSEAVRWRKALNGSVVKRRGHGKGHQFGAPADDLVGNGGVNHLDERVGTGSRGDGSCSTN